MSAYIVFLPCIILILYSMISKRTIEPIVFAVIFAYILKYGIHFLSHFLDGLYSTIGNETIVLLILMLTLFGGLIELIKISNGINKISYFLEEKIHSQRSALIATWLLAFTLFMDDYLNSLLVGTTMKKITDKYNIPREQVSLISITTSVPLSILAPVSTWAIFIFGILKTTSLDIKTGQIDIYYKIIPFAVYPLICIIGTGLLIAGILPKVFRLKKVYSNFTAPPSSNTRFQHGSMLNFIIPIATLVLFTITTLNIAFALILALSITITWLSLSKQFPLSESVDSFIKGMSTMTSPILFIIFAFTFGEILMELNFTNIVLNTIKAFINSQNLALFSFIFVASLVFFGIDVWATIPLVFPILLPIANVYNVNPFLVIGAILSGISLGTQLCFISESNILVSETVDLKPINQITVLLPYAIFYALITSAIYIYLGYSL